MRGVERLKYGNSGKFMVLAVFLVVGLFALAGLIGPSNQTAIAAGNFSVEYTQNDWGSGATVSVTIKNTGSTAINGWKLAWTYSGNQKITNMWNAGYTQNGAAVTVTNAAHNAEIPANGGTVNFGFNISYSGTNNIPTNFTLNGNPISTPTPTPGITPTPTLTSTPEPTPTPTPTGGEDDWKNNVGTINLGTTITYTGNGVATSGSTVTIRAGGDFTVTGSLPNGMIYVSTTEKVKLRLSGVDITNSTGPAIYIANADKAYITITEGTSNSLTDGKTYTDPNAKAAIFSNDSLEIKGAGALTVTGKYKHAIASDDNVIIENGDISIASAVKDGIHANNSVKIKGGNLKITATSDGIDSEGGLVMDDGNLTIAAGSDGIQTAKDLTINQGTINVTKAVEGLESKANLIINDGTINVVADDDGLNSQAGLTINGGTLTVTATAGDGIDSAGTVMITGGYTVVYGAAQPESCIDCGDRNFSITGGTLIGMGGNTSSPTAASSTQCAAILSGAAAGAVVSIQKADGTEILNLKPAKTGATLLYTSPLLVANSTYTMYINGTQSRQFATTSKVTVAGGAVLKP
jgi:hypothetical protein